MRRVSGKGDKVYDSGMIVSGTRSLGACDSHRLTLNQL